VDHLWQQKAPLKGNLSRISGMNVTPLECNAVFIRTEVGTEKPYEVRPFAQRMLAKLTQGQTMVL
jgi:hypothetical protein